MDDIFNLVLIVAVLVISAISSGAEKRRRARRARGEAPHPLEPTDPAAAEGDLPSPADAAGERWKAPAEEVRRFLKSIEERVAEAQEPRRSPAAEPPPIVATRPAATPPPAPPDERGRALPVAPPPGRATPVPRRADAMPHRAYEMPRRAYAAPRSTYAAPSSAGSALRPPVAAGLRALPRGDGYHTVRRTTASAVEVARIVGDRGALRRAVIAREILGPPKGLLR